MIRHLTWPWMAATLAACVAPDPATPSADDTDPTDGPTTDLDPPDAPIDPPAHSTVTTSGPITCPDPSLRETLGAFERRTVPITPASLTYVDGGNSSLADLNGDGRLDVVVVGEAEILVWFDIDTLGVALPTTLLQIPPTGGAKGLFGATAVDIDDDGDLDLWVTGRAVADHLLLNDGAGHFVDAIAGSGLEGYEQHYSAGSSLADIDADGDLDLFVAGHGYVDESLSSPTEFGPGDPSRLYENEGDGHFTDRSDRLPEETQTAYTFLAGWIDADHDGDQDLYLVNDFGNTLQPCQVLLNTEGRFQGDGGALGMDAAIPGMGLGIGDLNGDGSEEVAVPAWGRTVLLSWQGGSWFEEARARGYISRYPQTVGWGAEMVDTDNDGLLDITTAFGWIDSRFGDDNERSQPDALYQQTSEGVLLDRAPFAGFDDGGPHRSITPGDINRDGWLDHVKVGLDGWVRVYLARCSDEAWLEVLLRQPAPNSHAIGAFLQVSAGGQTWTRRLRAGGTGYGSGQPPEVHFGLGEVSLIDELSVTWPDGTVEVFHDVQPRQVLTIQRN